MAGTDALPLPPLEEALFGRRVSVLISSPVREFAKVGDLVVEVTDLRVQFKVSKSLGKEPNTAEIVITNLSRDRRAQLQQAGGKFILQAGYDIVVEQLFVGDIRNVSHIRDGADWNTLIKSGDGERAYRWARVNESFKSGTPVKDVLLKIAQALGIDEGNLGETAKQFVGQYLNGYSAMGPAARELDRILRSEGYSWSIQDGAVQVLRDDTSTTLLIPDLRPDTGLIGSPEIGADEKTKGPIVKAKSLLQPRIKPGGRVSITSERFKGEVRVTKVNHDGDTAGGPWYSSLEGEPL